MKVDLSPEEMRRWAYAGIDRRIAAMGRGAKGAHGFDREHEAWQIDVEGMLAEAAVAKALGVYFAPSVNGIDTHIGDVIKGVQVRSTRHGYNSSTVGCLLLHDSDRDDDRFVLVCGAYGRYRIPGWIHARDGKHDKFKRQHKGRWAYWVGQEWLKPFEPKGVQGVA